MNIKISVIAFSTFLILPTLRLQSVEPFSLQAHCLATIVRSPDAVLNKMEPRPKTIFDLPVPDELEKRVRLVHACKDILNSSHINDEQYRKLNIDLMVTETVLLLLKEKRFDTSTDIIHQACAHKNLPIELIQLLVKRNNPIFINTNHRYETETPLCKAVDHNRFDMVMLLFSLGALVDVPNTLGTTPLHRAAVSNDNSIDKKIIFALLDHGADINRVHPERQITPLQAAHKFHNQHFIDAVDEWKNNRPYA